MKELRGTVKIPKSIPGEGNSILYFPTCITRMMGAGEKKEKSIVDTIIAASKKAGYDIVIPDKISGVCCGQAFSSKGFSDSL